MASSEQTVPAKVAANGDHEPDGRRACRRRRGGVEVSRPTPPVEIGPNDPLLAYLQSATRRGRDRRARARLAGAAELRAAGVKLVVPLVSQGELIGVLNLGPRLSEQDYSADDRSCSTTSPPRRRRRCGSASSCASRRPRPRRGSASSRSSRSPS